jgi:E3 ubiquitin ligase SMURF1/2
MLATPMHSLYEVFCRWEERRTPAGRVHYVNHVTRTTQWERPTRSAYELASVRSARRSAPHLTRAPSPSVPPTRHRIFTPNKSSSHLNGYSPPSISVSAPDAAQPPPEPSSTATPTPTTRTSSTRHRNYMNRSALHPLPLPEGYGEMST